MVEITLCMVQDICPLGTIAIFEVVMLKKILIIYCFMLSQSAIDTIR